MSVPPRPPWHAAWEAAQRGGIAALADGEDLNAASQFAIGLRLARQHCAGDDPRLAISIANYGLILRAHGEPISRKMFEEALQVWDQAAAAQARQPAARRARSSLFHLRLEAKHRGAYDPARRRRDDLLAAEGRAAIAALAIAPMGPRALAVIRPEAAASPAPGQSRLATALALLLPALLGSLDG